MRIFKCIAMRKLLFTMLLASAFLRASSSFSTFGGGDCANCESSMSSRWLRLLALVITVALLLTSQCYALCTLSACSVTECKSHCHHHKSHSQTTDFSQLCHLQYSLVGPEQSASMCNLNPVHTSAAYVLVSTVEPALEMSAANQFSSDRGEGDRHTGISVFALLSTFRI